MAYRSRCELFELATIQGTVMLADADNGVLLAGIESGGITMLRIAAATAVAAKFLARKETQRMPPRSHSARRNHRI